MHFVRNRNDLHPQYFTVETCQDTVLIHNDLISPDEHIPQDREVTVLTVLHWNKTKQMF